MVNDQALATLTILKHDTSSLFKRIKFKKVEYLYILSAERKRDHFKEIFKTHYDTITFDHLLVCSEDVLHGLHLFYSKCDELKWYLNHTQELPMAIESKTNVFIKDIEVYFEQVEMAIDKDLADLNPMKPSSEFKVQEIAEEKSAVDHIKNINDQAYEQANEITSDNLKESLDPLPPPPEGIDFDEDLTFTEYKLEDSE